MNEIYLSKLNTPEKERAELIEKLDEIFKDEQLVMSVYSWSDQYFPIKSIKHFIENSPTYKGACTDLIVYFCSTDQCLAIRNLKNNRTFYINLANKKYLEDFPYIYEGKLSHPNEYIIPIKFK